MPSENSLKPHVAGGASPPGEPIGRASRPGEPDPLGESNIRLAGDGSPHRTARTAGSLPSRRKLPHGPPPFAVSGPAVQFVTLNAAERGGGPFLPAVRVLLDAARFYHGHGRWFLRLFLVMPDHLHMLATFTGGVKATCGAWKGFLRKTAGVRFQGDCFEHRIRNESEMSEKWHYIRENPVRKGLVATAAEWPWWLAFDPFSGRQIGGYEHGGASRLGEPGGASPPGEPSDELGCGGSPGTARPTGRLAGDGSPHRTARPIGRLAPTERFGPGQQDGQGDLNPIERERK